MVPTAAAAGALYVSAENAQFDNLFGGPMVIEVIVKDPNRSATNENAGEPTVLVDNNRLRLAQGLDGNWYGYFAYSTDVATLVAVGTGDHLDWGTASDITHSAGTTIIATFDVTTYHNGTISDAGFAGVIDNPPALSNWNSTSGLTCSSCGQIGITSVQWPFLQTFDLTQGDFDIVLEQAGTNENVTLDHNNADLDDYSGLTLDRNSATQGAEVHMFIVDQQLNIDPTDEDKVIFKVITNGTSGAASVAFTNGTLDGTLTDLTSGSLVSNVVNSTGYSPAGDGFGFGDNGKLLINFDTTSSGTNVLEKDTTDDDNIVSPGTLSDIGVVYLVFVEDADNTGTFSNVDDNDDSNLDVTSDAKRGTTATFDYNDSAQSFIVSNDFGTIDMDESSVGVEWNSGETLTVTLVDQDLNKNTLSDEDMTLRSHNTTIPSMQIGSPITLTEDSGIGAFGDLTGLNVSSFSKIGTIHATSSVTAAALANVTVSFNGTTVAEFRLAAAAADFTFVNYNVTEVVNALTGIAITSGSGTGLIANEATTSTAGLLQMTGGIADAGTAVEEASTLLLNFTGISKGMQAAEGETLFVDIFTFGDVTGQDRANNAIYRFLLEESGDNTATFVGDVEFVMLNQLNSDTATVFGDITTLSDSIDIIVHEDLTDEDSPRINYLDLGSDGVSTQTADQVEAPSHSGVVTFDNDNYKTADTVVVTLNDQDMNTDS